MNLTDKMGILWRLFFENRVPAVFSFHDCLPEVFSRTLELLVFKRYRILDSGEYLERLNVGRRAQIKPQGEIRREVLLTFDDGRRNCWTVIFPLLKKYKAKALFFVIPSRIKDSEEHYPNLEDYWAGRVSWESLYLSHQTQPYMTWRELAVMRESGLVEIFPHGFRHDVVSVSSRVLDFQHPGVYEMPVYFDEWFQRGRPALETIWGSPIYERMWSPQAANIYMPDRRADLIMNEFVRKSGGFLFFRKKKWRKRLFEYFDSQKKNFSGHFKKNEQQESAWEAVVGSKEEIDKRLRCDCAFFSLPLYQANGEILNSLAEAGYRVVFCGPRTLPREKTRGRFFLVRRIPGFWLKFLQYF